MGIFKFIKKSIDDEYNLDNLEDLVYEDEPLDTDENLTDEDFKKDLKSYDMGELFAGLGFDGSGNRLPEESDVVGRKKNVKNQKDLRREEEKYDELLNSVQAQNLIKTVEKINVEANKEKQKEKIEEGLEEGKDSLYIKNGKKRLDIQTDEDIYQQMGVDNEKELYRKLETSKVDREIDKLEIDLPDVSKKPKALDKVNTSTFMPQDMEIYVKSQCDIMEEASSYVERAKLEYETVAEYYEDTNKICDAPTNMKLKVENAAERVENLTTDRRISRGMGNQLPMEVFRKLESLEDQIPGAIDDIQSQENYYENVKRDMRMLEGERINLKSEAKSLVRRQLNIRSLAITTIICLMVVFVVFVIAMFKLQDDANTLLFVIVTALAAALALFMFALLRRTEREVYVVENKINKATTLLNKVKIKYINAANTLDYEYAKYDITSSYELAEKFKLFNIMRADQKHLVEMTSALSSAEKELEDILRMLDLYDPHIWLSQARAILSDKEMVEIRHKLTSRRQKLRGQIEYNENRIKEAKNNIKNVTNKNPQYAADALRVVEMYERKHAF
ncbi:hypothetical protein [Lachnospira multipara]|uniref:Uncharacterized protein n=2 Tax=Lachnospira TaxID=28050 RepID=A0A1H5SBX6_9FIRM|nr:hypothetical protein [Lachnospira multipara]SEF47904.1 hypothetical protein SAMN05216537_102157 [Lachnospira multipara]